MWSRGRFFRNLRLTWKRPPANWGQRAVPPVSVDESTGVGACCCGLQAPGSPTRLGGRLSGTASDRVDSLCYGTRRRELNWACR